MNHLRFNEYGELISKDIRGVVATSNEADEIFIFYDKDISTSESGYLASVRMERCDGLKIGPINLTLTAKSFDTENKANNYGIPSWNDATEKWDVPCRLLKLTDEMLGVDGDLSLSVVYTEVLEGGQKKVKVNQMVIIKVFGAVDNLYTEEQYDNLLGLFLQKDLSGLTTADAVAGINEFIIKQVGETKLITAENLRLYAVAKIVDGSTIAKKAEQDANGNVITAHYETIDHAKSEIDKIKDGTTIVNKTTKDASGNVITQTYLNKATMTPQAIEAELYLNNTLYMQDSKISGLGNATEDTEAVNKGQLDSKVATEINKIIGGTYTVDKATNDKDGNRIDTTYEKVSRKNEISGYVGLDANKKIPLTYLYDGVLGQLEYGGVFNPSVGYPTDTNSLDTNRPIRKGDYFIANADGTAGGVSYNTGDWAIRSADNWQKIDNTDAVASVNGKLGVVVLDGTDIKVGNGDTATLQARFVAIDALINSRYTKSEVYNKTETDAIINDLKTMYGWEQTLIVEKLAQGSVHYVALTTLATLNEYDFVLFTLKFSETYYTKLLNPAHLEPQDIIFFEGDTYYKSMFVDEEEDTTIRFSHNMEGLAVVDVFVEGIKIAEQKAINITYDNVDSGLTAENVQEAIDELENEIDLGLEQKTDKLEYRQVGETTIQRNSDGLVIEVINPTAVSTPLYVDGKLVSLNETHSDGKSYVTTFNRLPDGTLVSINKQEVL